jgi:hypothetical protein
MEFDNNRKKYGEYRFKNRNVDHGLVTEIIQSLKQFTNSAFIEYKGDNLFILSNYKMEALKSMIEHVQQYDKPVQENQNNSTIWAMRRDWNQVLNEISKLENIDNNINISLNKKTKLYDYNNKQFILTDEMNIVEAIDNYIDDTDNNIYNINLSEEDLQFIKLSEDEFRKNHLNNKFYHL